MPRVVSVPRLIAAALGLGAVGLLGLAVLALAGAMPWGAALIAAVVLLAGIAWRLARPMKDAAAIAAMAEHGAETEIPPAVRTPELIEIGASLARARTGSRGEADALARRAGAAEGILEALPDPVLLLDRDRRVVRANPAARELLGVDPSGDDLAGFLRAPPVLAAARAVLADGQVRELAYRVDVPVERHFGVRIAPIGGNGGDRGDKGPRAVVRLVDLTAVKRAEEMRADFAANASHELKTPLSALIGFIETLRGPARDDTKAQERFLGLMAAQTERMSRLVDDLLALSSIELVEHAPPTSPVALDAVVRAAAQALELRAADRNMKVDIVVDDGLPPVPGDAEQLAQLIQNLLDNALKYGAAGSTVTLRLALVPAPAGMGGGRAVALSVADRGEGIAEEHLPRLTERFYRVDSARSRAAGGTGLGLAIVKHIVGRHRGQLKIESTVGVGSTFTAYLPAARAEP
jgi:two-component system, OmpR family, phosphate regulon sensor histidine kinase PhoR